MHLLFNEIFDKVSKAKTKPQKIDILKEHESDSLKMLIKSSFDPKIEWVLPVGNVPYVANEAPAGTEHTVLESECRKIWHFIKGADNKTKQQHGTAQEHLFTEKIKRLFNLLEDNNANTTIARPKKLN